MSDLLGIYSAEAPVEESNSEENHVQTNDIIRDNSKICSIIGGLRFGREFLKSEDLEELLGTEGIQLLDDYPEDLEDALLAENYRRLVNAASEAYKDLEFVNRGTIAEQHKLKDFKISNPGAVEWMFGQMTTEDAVKKFRKRADRNLTYSIVTLAASFSSSTGSFLYDNIESAFASLVGAGVAAWFYCKSENIRGAVLIAEQGHEGLEQAYREIYGERDELELSIRAHVFNENLNDFYAAAQILVMQTSELDSTSQTRFREEEPDFDYGARKTKFFKGLAKLRELVDSETGEMKVVYRAAPNKETYRVIHPIINPLLLGQ